MREYFRRFLARTLTLWLIQSRLVRCCWLSTHNFLPLMDTTSTIALVICDKFYLTNHHLNPSSATAGDNHRRLTNCEFLKSRVADVFVLSWSSRLFDWRQKRWQVRKKEKIMKNINKQIDFISFLGHLRLVKRKWSSLIFFLSSHQMFNCDIKNYIKFYKN